VRGRRWRTNDKFLLGSRGGVVRNVTLRKRNEGKWGFRPKLFRDWEQTRQKRCKGPEKEGGLKNRRMLRTKRTPGVKGDERGGGYKDGTQGRK